MKKLIIPMLLLFLGCSGKPAETGSHEYYCPMHPEVTADKPGVCPICNMNLVKKADSRSEAVPVGKYYCPMHPEVLSDGPGHCPKCEKGGHTMEMVKKESDESASTIQLTASKQILANVRTEAVDRRPFVTQLQTYAVLDYAEPNRRMITARFDGRVERLFINKTGDYVRLGQPLFEVYSPVLIQAQNDYVIALDQKTLENNTRDRLIAAARRKLALYGLSDRQIAQIDSTREVAYTVRFESPVAGTVVVKNIVEGQYVSEGTNLFDVADFSTLWVMADVYEKDIRQIRQGQKMDVTLAAYPEEKFSATVDYVYPTVEPQSRSIKVRAVIGNPSGRLRPQMFGTAMFDHDFGMQLVVPAGAVLHTGPRDIVWVERSKNQFEMREIAVGEKSDGYFRVVSGLMRGEKVAVEGGYLIDSESQLSGKRHTH